MMLNNLSIVVLLMGAGNKKSGFHGFVEAFTSLHTTYQNRQFLHASSTELFFFNFGPKKDEIQSKEEETPKPPKQEVAPVEDDPVEKLFQFFFGEKEEAPMGMVSYIN